MSRDPLFPPHPSCYERPQGNFQCGDAARGNPCPLGPLGNGVCSRERDCRPVEREGRWFCTRSAAAGGPCSDGPSPTGECGQPARDCLPRPTLRKQRGWFVAAAFATTLGLLLICGARDPKRWLAPGPLTSNHARLLSQPSQGTRCEACHPAGSDSVSAWFASIVGHRAETSATQTGLCLTCHNDLAPSPRSAHGMTAEALRSVQTVWTSVANEPTARVPRQEHFHDKQWACSVCHQEHHGPNHELTALQDSQCATCHQNPFHSFATGHPEFRNWPTTANATITFNHSTHQWKHYSQAKRDFSCRDCHQNDPLGSFQVVSYDACRSCHETKIKSTTEGGIALLALPMLDLSAMRSHLTLEDRWPSAAQGSFDGTLPPWMYLLLLNDMEVAPLLEERGPQFDLIDLNSNSTADMQDAARLMRAIRRLSEELASDARACIQERLASDKNAPLSDTELDALVGGLPQEFLRETVASWFPASDGQSADVGDTSLLRGKNRASVQLAQATDDDLLTDASNGDEDSESLIEPDEKQATANAEKTDDSQDELLLDDPVGSSTVPSGDPHPEASNPSSPVATAMGWKRSEFGQQLLYVPSGHSDPFVAAWLAQWTKRLANQETTAGSLDALRERVWGLPLVENCLSCHTGENRDGSLVWKASAAQRLKSFTKFSHRPHLLQPELQNCQHCHVASPIAESQNLVNSQASTEPTPSTLRDRFMSQDFQPIQKATCASCHRAQGASDRCLECHNYHVQEALGSRN